MDVLLSQKIAKLSASLAATQAQVTATNNTSTYPNLNKGFKQGLGTDVTTQSTKTILDTSSLSASNTPLSASVCPKYAKYSFVGSGTYVNTGKNILNVPISSSYSMGAWIKIDTLSDLPTGLGIRFIFSGVSIDLMFSMSTSNFKEGYSSTSYSNNVTGTIQVQKILNGWMYVSVIIQNIPSGVTSFWAYIQPTVIAVSTGVTGAISVMDWVIIASDSIVYSTIYSDTVATSSKPFANKNVITMGDSITALSGTSGWITYLKLNISPSSFANTAVNGAKWTDYTGTVYDGNPVWNGTDNNVNNVIGNQVQKILNGTYTTPDIIIIAAGTNDSTDSTVIETQFTSGTSYIPLTSVDRKTLAGAMRYSIETLQTKYPDVQIFIVLPIQSFEGTRQATVTKQKCDILRSVANRLSVPVIDAYSESGIYGEFELSGASGRDLVDGLHPNDHGGKKLGNYISRQIANWYSV